MREVESWASITLKAITFEATEKEADEYNVL